MKPNQFAKLVSFLDRLEEARIVYHIDHSREDAVMVSVVSPGVYWEIEFLKDGGIDVERYLSKGEIEEEFIIEELFAAFSDGEPSTEGIANHNDAVARK